MSFPDIFHWFRTTGRDEHGPSWCWMGRGSFHRSLQLMEANNPCTAVIDTVYFLTNYFNDRVQNIVKQRYNTTNPSPNFSPIYCFPSPPPRLMAVNRSRNIPFGFVVFKRPNRSPRRLRRSVQVVTVSVRSIQFGVSIPVTNYFLNLLSSVQLQPVGYICK